MTAQDVLDFWFNQPPQNWFRKNDAFDAQIRARFGATIDTALAGGLREWEAEGAQGTLARILVLDQFTRNAFRNQPKSFAGDALALADARALVDGGGDRTLSAEERQFAYLPFEHAEDLQMQQRSLSLFTQLAQENHDMDEVLDYARRHSVIIERFGRFPHRNAILGRASTALETAFLAEPGSGF